MNRNDSSPPVTNNCSNNSINRKDMNRNDSSPPVTNNCSNNSIKRKNTSGNDSSPPATNNHCSNYYYYYDYGFCLDYESYLQMYQMTCRRQPNILENVSNDIRILVTHMLEEQKFWGWILSESKVYVKELNKIEKQIATAAKKSPPPYVLPKAGYCGVALFNDTWYRCFILKSNDETGKLKVFYCDYGNTELINLEQFRFTSIDVWNLPPQAIPFKIHDGVLQNPHKNLNPMDGQFLKATVIKTKHPQPHIVEVINISCVCSSANDTNCSWCHEPSESVNGCDETVSIVSSGTSVTHHASENVAKSKQTEIFGMTSLFKYENEDLVLGIFSEVHHPNLVYLKLGDESQFASLRSTIDKAELILPNDLSKGKLLLLKANGKISRVCILQMFTGFAQVKVLHVDSGVIEWVAMNHLYHLDRDLRETRYQAKPAVLAGIDCKEKIEEAILYLKSKVNSVVIANIMHENTSGKIYVELFDLETKRSINKEIVDNGLAAPAVDNILYTDEDVTPYMIPLDKLKSNGSQSRLIPLIERLFKS